jgi:hypothetical protein
MIRLLPALCLATALLAQESTSPYRFVPKDANLVVRIAAPQRWRQHFARTQVAKLLRGPTLQPLVQQLSAAVDMGLDQARQSGEIDADLLEGLLTTWSGEFVFGLQIDLGAIAKAMTEGEPPPVRFVLALTPDGKYDLAALATECSQLAEEAATGGRTLRDLTVGDHRLRLAAADDMQFTVPALIDGQLVVLAGTDLEQTAAKLLGGGEHYESKEDAPFALHVGLTDVVNTLVTAAMAADGQDPAAMPFDPIELLDALGFGSLDSLDVTIAAEDAHARLDVSLDLNEKERGILAMLAVEQGAPRLLRMLPPNAEHFGAGAFDIGAMYATVAKLWQRLEQVVPMSFEQAMAAATESLKIRIKEDLIDHIGTEVLQVVDPAAVLNPADEDVMAAMSGSCYGVALRNGRAFAESVETAFRARGLHAGRKTEDYQSIKVHRMKVGGMLEFEYAIADDVLLVAPGGDEASRRNLRAILDARASGASAPELPDATKKLLDRMPSGWSGVSATPLASLTTMAETLLEQVENTGEDVPQEARMVLGVLKGAVAELKHLGIASVVSTTRMAGGGFHVRALW